VEIKKTSTRATALIFLLPEGEQKVLGPVRDVWDGLFDFTGTIIVTWHAGEEKKEA